MKLIVILALLCAFTLTYGTNVKKLLKKLKPTCIGKGIIKIVECYHNDTLNPDVSDLEVYFYDYKTEKEHLFTINEAPNKILSIKTLNKTSKFVMYIGGFKSSLESKSVQRLKENLKQISNSYVIIINHSNYTYSKSWYTIDIDYSRSAAMVPYIGKRVAKMLEVLTKNTISPKNIHCIGFSLGGQMLGQVADDYFQLTGQKIARISALDPAGPCFDGFTEQLKVKRGVADYVEVYHCNDGCFGTSSVLADADFFVNSGTDQPGCQSFPPRSHSRCYKLWAMSIMKPNIFTAYQCQNYKMFTDNMCLNNTNTIAGFWNPGVAKGKYFFSTKHVTFD